MKYTANETIPDGTNVAGRLVRPEGSQSGVGALQIPPEQIAGYVFKRSPASHFKFNCYAVDSDGDLLFCLASDLDFEKASSWVDALNREYYPEVLTETELVEIQLAEEKRIFNVNKG